MSVIARSMKALEDRIIAVSKEILAGGCTHEEYKASCATIEALNSAIAVMREERVRARQEQDDDEQE